MATTFDPYGEELGASGGRPSEHFRHAAGVIKNEAADELRKVIADVEDLVARIADLNDADVASLRERVKSTVASAKESLAESAETVKRQAQNAWNGADDYVHESPWVAVGVAALVGAVVGILVSRR